MRTTCSLTKQQLSRLLDVAKKEGATDATIIESKALKVENRLAALCDGDYRCPNYGLSAGCSPHVQGPEVFRDWQAKSQYSIVVKIELPTSALFSDDRNTVMQQLHFIVASVEQTAIEMGWSNSKGFAGGSCKELFCSDQPTCVVLDKEPCLYGDRARPSISGFGIDAIQMMKSAGWTVEMAEKTNMVNKESTSWIAGLILLF